MKKTTRTFTLERETPNTIRYREEPDAGEPPIIETIYIKKWALGTPPPKSISVTIDPGQ